MGEEILSEAVYVAPLKNFSRDLKIHFSAGLLHQATDERTVEFLHQLIQEEDHGALLIPSALRAYYPLIAATNNIRVKPLHLLNLVLTLRPFLTLEMTADLRKVTHITDKSRIRRMLANDFTSDTVFDAGMEFDCLMGFEKKLEDKNNPGGTSKFAVAVGITSRGVMYIHHSKKNSQDSQEDCTAVSRLLTAAVATALDQLRTKRVRNSVSASKSVIGILENNQERVCAVVHASDRILSNVFCELKSERGEFCHQASEKIFCDLVTMGKISQVNAEDVQDSFSTAGGRFEMMKDMQYKKTVMSLTNVFLLMGQSNMAGRGKIQATTSATDVSPTSPSTPSAAADALTPSVPNTSSQYLPSTACIPPARSVGRSSSQQSKTLIPVPSSVPSPPLEPDSVDFPNFVSCVITDSIPLASPHFHHVPRFDFSSSSTTPSHNRSYQSACSSAALSPRLPISPSHTPCYIVPPPRRRSFVQSVPVPVPVSALPSPPKPPCDPETAPYHLAISPARSQPLSTCSTPSTNPAQTPSILFTINAPPTSVSPPPSTYSTALPLSSVGPSVPRYRWSAASTSSSCDLSSFPATHLLVTAPSSSASSPPALSPASSFSFLPDGSPSFTLLTNGFLSPPRSPEITSQSIVTTPISRHQFSKSPSSYSSPPHTVHVPTSILNPPLISPPLSPRHSPRLPLTASTSATPPLVTAVNHTALRPSLPHSTSEGTPMPSHVISSEPPPSSSEGTSPSSTAACISRSLSSSSILRPATVTALPPPLLPLPGKASGSSCSSSSTPAVHHSIPTLPIPPVPTTIPPPPPPHSILVGSDSWVVSFDPLKGWTHQCGEDLHFNVDVLKRAKVGLGPGPSFAQRFHQLRNKQNGSRHPVRRESLPSPNSPRNRDSNLSSIYGDCQEKKKGGLGLVPCAVGGSSLKEWTSDYLQHRISSFPTPLTSSSRSKGICFVPHCDLEGYFVPPPNVFHPGCPNLLSCAMRSLYLSLLHATCEDCPSESLALHDHRGGSSMPIVGVLWCQGESDAMEQTVDYMDQDPMLYGLRLSLFTGRLRVLMDAVMKIIKKMKERVVPRRRKSYAAGTNLLGKENISVKKFGMAMDYIPKKSDFVPISISSVRTAVTRPIPIPVVSVAVSSTHPSLTHLDCIRTQQMEALEFFPAGTQYMQVPRPQHSTASSSISTSPSCTGTSFSLFSASLSPAALEHKIAYYSVVDAFGLELSPDCLHFTAAAATVLGHRLAASMVSLMGSMERGEEGEGSRRRPHEGHVRSALLPTSETDGEDLDTHLVKLNGILEKTRSESVKKLIAQDLAKSDSSRTGHFRSSGLKAINFTHGEVLLPDFCRALLIALRSISECRGSAERAVDLKFADLGCGNGNCMAGALLVHEVWPASKFQKESSAIVPVSVNGLAAFETHAAPSRTPLFSMVLGIDLMRSKVGECEALTAAMREGGYLEDKAEVRLSEGDFLRSFRTEGTGWNNADVVYACATCFADDVMSPLVALFKKLKVGAHIVLIDKPLLTNGQTWNIAGNSKSQASPSPFSATDCALSNDSFGMAGSCQVACSWGLGCAYIYRKIK